MSMHAERNSGFTLIEMLAVITIVSLLAIASFGAGRTADKLGKTTKAEAELRELVNAFTQYCVTYPDEDAWPSAVKDQPATPNLLKYVCDPTGNSYGLVFLNANIPTGKNYCDPWGMPYRITISRTTRTRENKYATSVPLVLFDPHDDIE